VPEGRSCWIQWQYIPEVKEQPILPRRALLPSAAETSDLMASFDAGTNRPRAALRAYGLTSANDHPERHTQEWPLLGSNDNGRTWDKLDTQEAQQFHSRGERRVYTLANPAKYGRFRLEFISVNDPSTANALQLAQIEPIWEDSATPQSYSLAVR